VQKTSIEWVRNPDGSPGFTFNPITGCLNHVNGLCKGGNFSCYAYRLAHGRLKNLYLANKNLAHDYLEIKKAFDRGPEPFTDPFYPRFWMNRIEEWNKRTEHEWGGGRIVKHRHTPRGVFVCDMSDWCGIGIPESWLNWILEIAKRNPDDRFYLLTKQPQNLVKFSPFPPNCWVGRTVTNNDAYYKDFDAQAKVKFISFEPLLEGISAGRAGTMYSDLERWDINWLIIGACTGTRDEIKQLVYRYPELTPMPVDFNMRRWTAQPRIEWVEEIVRAADKAGLPVFLKDNLSPLILGDDKTFYDTQFVADAFGHLRQEMPK